MAPTHVNIQKDQLNLLFCLHESMISLSSGLPLPMGYIGDKKKRMDVEKVGWFYERATGTTWLYRHVYTGLCITALRPGT